MQKRVVVGGAGFGGLAAALSLARLMPEIEVVLVDAHRSHVYTPWLYEVATGFLFEPGRKSRSLLRRGAHVPYEEIVRYAPGNVRFRQGHVASIDPEGKQFVFEDGMTLRYDLAILSFGSEGEDYGIPGVKEFGMPLKSLADGIRIEERLQELLFHVKNDTHKKEVKVVIGGAGAAGVETAAELAHYIHLCMAEGVCRDTMEITLVDAVPNILNAFPAHLQKAATRRAKRIGVTLRMDSAITRVDEGRITTKKGQIPYDILIWTGGIRPNRLTAGSSLQRDPRGRLQSDVFGQAKDRADLFVLGDGAVMIDPRTSKSVPPAAWAAMQEGRQVGENVARMLSGLAMRPLAYPRLYPAVVTVGGHYSVATVMGVCFSGFFAFVLRRLIDFHYFQTILPWSVAFKLWLRGAQIFEKNDRV